MASKRLKTYIALLSLTTCKKENVWGFLRGIAQKEGVSDDELIDLIEQGKSGVNMPKELWSDWLMFHGRIFEGYIAKRLKKHFDIINWTSDKCFGRVMAPNASEPDLTLLCSGSKQFAVECKWHHLTEGKRQENQIRFAQDTSQVGRYKDFQDKNKIKCFIAIGYGDNGNDITEIYIVPLDYIIETTPNTNAIFAYKIMKYRVTYNQGLKEIIERELNK